MKLCFNIEIKNRGDLKERPTGKGAALNYVIRLQIRCINPHPIKIIPGYAPRPVYRRKKHLKRITDISVVSSQYYIVERRAIPYSCNE